MRTHLLAASLPLLLGACAPAVSFVAASLDLPVQEKQVASKGEQGVVVAVDGPTCLRAK